MIILLHSSKTMRTFPTQDALRPPAFLEKALPLANYLKKLSKAEIVGIMGVSDTLAEKAKLLYEKWNDIPDCQSPAMDSFLGDIYSGFRSRELSEADRGYADQSVRILSGLYGIIRPLDGICPYRLEMAYKLPGTAFADLSAYWLEDVLSLMSKEVLLINLSSIEYAQPFITKLDPTSIYTPRFLSVDPKKNQATFVAVHAKVARGAFARWLVTTRIDEPDRFKEFSELGYQFQPQLSTVHEPVFICHTFGGKGLSQRLV